MVVFKMRDSVPRARYSSVCNVLRQWSISLIPTYRVYQLYDILVYTYCTHENSSPYKSSVYWIYRRDFK